MFLKINTAHKTRGSETLSEAVRAFGVVASIVAYRPSQAERQLKLLHKLLLKLTSKSSLELRRSVIAYGDARFYGESEYTKLGPTLRRLVDDKVAIAKAAYPDKAEAA